MNSLETRIWNSIKRAKGRRKYPIMEFESEKLKYILIKNYLPDFVLTRKNGKKTYIEVKGYLRPSDRTKMKAVKLLDPTLDIRFVFARDNKINKNSRTRYSDWARKNGFPYAVGEIPKTWLEN